MIVESQTPFLATGHLHLRVCVPCDFINVFEHSVLDFNLDVLAFPALVTIHSAVLIPTWILFAPQKSYV